MVNNKRKQTSEKRTKLESTGPNLQDKTLPRWTRKGIELLTRNPSCLLATEILLAILNPYSLFGHYSQHMNTYSQKRSYSQTKDHIRRNSKVLFAEILRKLFATYSLNINLTRNFTWNPYSLFFRELIFAILRKCLFAKP